MPGKLFKILSSECIPLYSQKIKTAILGRGNDVLPRRQLQGGRLDMLSCYLGAVVAKGNNILKTFVEKILDGIGKPFPKRTSFL